VISNNKDKNTRIGYNEEYSIDDEFFKKVNPDISDKKSKPKRIASLSN